VTVDAACTEDGSLSTDNVKRHSYGQHSSSMEIQLAPSETKPFTRSDMLCCVLFSFDCQRPVLFITVPASASSWRQETGEPASR